MSCGGIVLAREVLWATSFRARGRGLLDVPRLRAGQALILSPAKQVHTFGMAYPVDVVFCDSSWIIRHLRRALTPNRITRVVLSARHAVELPAGTVPASVERGHPLKIVSRAGVDKPC